MQLFVEMPLILVSGEGNSVTTRFSISVISGPGSGAPGSQLTFVVQVRGMEPCAPATVAFSITSGNGQFVARLHKQDDWP